MLDFADEAPGSISRQRGLARPGEAEVQGDVAVARGVGRAVHRQHVTAREHVVHHREQRLLDLPATHRAHDEHQAAAEEDTDEDRRAALGAGLAGRQGAAVDDREAGLELLQVDRLGAHQQGVREQGVPGGVGDDPHRHAVGGFRADEAVEHVHLPPAEVLAGLGEQTLDGLRAARLIDVAPVDVSGSRIGDDVAVARRAAGAHSRRNDQRAVGREDAFAAPGSAR